MLLLGYGGAASVMAYHCVTQGAYLTITGRNLEKAEALQKQLTDAVPGARISVFSRRHIPRDIHIVLNSTPVGMYPKENAAPLHYLPHKTEYVFDAIYNPPVTSTMKLANPRKTKTRDGLFMLVMQAAHAQTIWTGVTFSRRHAKPFCAAPTAKWRSSVCTRSMARKKSGAVRLYGQRQDHHRP